MQQLCNIGECCVNKNGLCELVHTRRTKQNMEKEMQTEIPGARLIKERADVIKYRHFQDVGINLATLCKIFLKLLKPFCETFYTS